MTIAKREDTGALFVGIDLGTGGVRAMAVSDSGAVAAEASAPFPPGLLEPQPGRHEQPPEAWWQAVGQVCRAMLSKLDSADGERLRAVAVDGTSGTLVAVDRAGKPARPALMYNDPRAAEAAETLNAAAPDFCEKLGYRFNASFALAKIGWLRTAEPAAFEQTGRFLHQADFVVERLTGNAAVTDASNALKTGYDLVEERWPDWIEASLGVASRLPKVVPPGTVIGRVSRLAAAETGLPEGLAVVAGATDGTAAFIASGARQPGDFNTTLGTTLVFKGISPQLCKDPGGLIYCHKLPGGWWLPGAASNTGAEWIGKRLPGLDVRELDRAAAALLPSDCLAYPLARTGERFPFLAPAARGFFLPEPPRAAECHAAGLQGVALLERLSYRVLDAAAGTAGGEVYSTGGGSRSDVWMQCRADANQRMIHRPACGESAFGAAVLAAAGTRFGGLPQAIAQMVRIERSFAPETRLAGRYDALFDRFCAELRTRGYL